jgi:hypothetical protein
MSAAATPTGSPVRTPFWLPQLGFCLVISTRICVEGLDEDLAVVQALAPRQRARHTTSAGHAPHGDRALDGMGRPKATALGQPAGPQSSGPLWPWAAVTLKGIENFFNFL